MPSYCPICGDVGVTTVFDNLKLMIVSAAAQQSAAVGGLAAFRCSNAHIFFVREHDIRMRAVITSAGRSDD